MAIGDLLKQENGSMERSNKCSFALRAVKKLTRATTGPILALLDRTAATPRMDSGISRATQASSAISTIRHLSRVLLVEVDCRKTRASVPARVDRAAGGADVRESKGTFACSPHGVVSRSGSPRSNWPHARSVRPNFHQEIYPEPLRGSGRGLFGRDGERTVVAPFVWYP
jgi:hypothetical protein